MSERVTSYSPITCARLTQSSWFSTTQWPHYMCSVCGNLISLKLYSEWWILWETPLSSAESVCPHTIGKGTRVFLGESLRDCFVGGLQCWLVTLSQHTRTCWTADTSISLITEAFIRSNTSSIWTSRVTDSYIQGEEIIFMRPDKHCISKHMKYCQLLNEGWQECRILTINSTGGRGGGVMNWSTRKIGFGFLTSGD